MARWISLGGDGSHATRPEGPDFRLLQTGFALVVVTSAITKAQSIDGTSAGLRLSMLLVIGIVLAVVALGPRLSPVVLVIVAYLDIGVAGLARTAPDGAGMGLLAGLPALWLCYRYGRVGALSALIAILALISLPALVFAEGADRILPTVVLPVTIAALLVLATLMTERVDEIRADAEVRSARLDAVMTSVSVGVLVLDAQGEIVSINPVARELMGLAYPAGAHPGVQPGAHAAFAMDGVTPLAQEERPTVRATRGEEFDDMRCWIGPDPEARRAVSITSRRLHLPNGPGMGQVLAVQDITELIEATRARDRFLSAASHELRTPVMVVLNHADLLARRPEIEQGDFPEVAAIARGTERLTRLVEDMMSVIGVPEEQLVVESGEMNPQTLDSSPPRDPTRADTELT